MMMPSTQEPRALAEFRKACGVMASGFQDEEEHVLPHRHADKLHVESQLLSSLSHGRKRATLESRGQGQPRSVLESSFRKVTKK